MNLSIIKQIIVLRRKSLFALSIVFSVSLGLQAFMQFYHEPRLEKLQADWLKQRESDGQGAALQSREVIYKNGIADLAKFRERIYQKIHFARFIGELYELAATNSLKMKSINYKHTLNKEEQLLDYDLTLNVSGTYYHLKKFIDDLGASANILVINSISLASTSQTADTVELKIGITSFFRMEGL